MRLLLNILIVCCAFEVCAQNIPNTDLVVHVKMHDLSFNIHVLEHKETPIEDFSPDKFYFWYKSQQIITTQGGGSGQLLDGTYTCYYKSKQLCEQGSFSKGLKNGIWRYWNENGILQKQEHWKKGVQTGVQYHYDSLGSISKKTKIGLFHTRVIAKDSLLIFSKHNSRLTVLDSTGKTLSIQRKRNGALHGIQIQRGSDGSFSKTKYKHGRLIEPKAKKESTQRENTDIPEKRGIKNWLSRKRGNKDATQEASTTKPDSTSKKKFNLFRKKSDK